MRKLYKYFNFGTAIFSLILFSRCHTIIQPDEYYCTIQAGEATQTSVCLLGRLQKSDTLVNNDLTGIEGYVKFRLTRETNSSSFMESPFYQLSDINDFIAKYEFSGLRPGQKYFYSIAYGRDTCNITSSAWSTFNTLNPAISDKNVNFIIGNGMNYDGIGGNTSGIANINRQNISIEFGSIFNWKPDFMILNGNDSFSDDKNYQDNQQTSNSSIAWHGFYSLPEYTTFLSNLPAFWIGPENSNPGRAYADHVPLPLKLSERNFSRTYRLNRDVQIWILGNSESQQSGSQKNISGNGQLKWLKSSLKESNSPFKLIISPNSFIGPVAITQNTSNPGPFQTEKDSLFTWLKNNGFRNNGLYFFCCNAPFQYHSIDPSGFEEFSCGTLNDCQSTAGIMPGDSLSTDPLALVKHAFLQKETSGGFLLINSDRDELSSPFLLLRFFDDQRKLLYAVNKF